eukprot:g481.t1
MADSHHPFTEEKKEQMQESITATVSTFTQSYAQAYSAALVNSLRTTPATRQRRSSLAMPAGLMLHDAPPPSQILCEGWLEKKGAIRKNWKKRWFVCYNKDRNFVVEYSVSSGRKPKGEICLDGYSISTEMTKAEREDCGEHSIVLTCGPSSKRRAWFLRATTKEEMDEFIPTFENACRKAKPEFKVGDAVEGEAFEAAYNDLRFEKELGLGVPGGSEEECLAGLVSEVVVRDVMGEVFDGFPGDVKGRTLRSGAQKAMDAAVALCQRCSC